MVVQIRHKAMNKLKEAWKKDFITQLYVSGGGCNGFEWNLKQIPSSHVHEMDEWINKYIVIEKKSILYVIGSILDYKESLKESGFTLKNPRAENHCGCGKSFNIKLK